MIGDSVEGTGMTESAKAFGKREGWAGTNGKEGCGGF